MMSFHRKLINYFLKLRGNEREGTGEGNITRNQIIQIVAARVQNVSLSVMQSNGCKQITKVQKVLSDRRRGIATRINQQTRRIL